MALYIVGEQGIGEGGCVGGTGERMQRKQKPIESQTPRAWTFEKNVCQPLAVGPQV